MDAAYLWEPVVQTWGWWHCPEAQYWCQALGCWWWETWGLDLVPHVAFSTNKHIDYHHQCI